jgi:sugar/nucleoside kinase (ribokinase family)
MPAQRGPVVCLGYLAAASLWNVANFPEANRGAEIFAIEQSIAADGPMVAAVLCALGMPSLLLANDVGDDARGIEVLQWLRRYGVATLATADASIATPQIVVVADNARTRTWFPYLPGVVDARARMNLTPLADASFAYVDSYQLIETPAVRAIHAARSAAVPLLLNLGGSPLSSRVADAVRGHPGLITQTNVDDDYFNDASRIAPFILGDTEAEWVVITGGASGALALSRNERLVVPAFAAEIRHTHCAGAAFSGGLIFGLLHGWPMSESLALASASGALRCEHAHHEPLPTLAELYAVIGSRERMAVPAA